MLDRLAVENFKAFQKQSVNLRPITILVGPNNAGKSSLLAPLRLLAQTLQSLDYQAPLLLNGPLGDFGTYRDVVHLNHRGRPLSIDLSLSETLADRQNWRAQGVGRREPAGSAASPWTPRGRRLRLHLEFKYRSQRRELILREATIYSAQKHLVTLTYVEETNRHVISKLTGRTVPPQQRSGLRPLFGLQHFLPRFTGVVPPPSMQETLFEGSTKDTAKLLRDARLTVQPIVATLQRVEYIGAMRSPPERTYQHAGETYAHIGATGANWANAVVMDTARRRTQVRLAPAVIRWMRDAGLASDLRVHWLDDRHYEIQMRHPESGEYENIADVGQGNSQVVPVIVGGFQLDRGSTYIVEEPEIHLHPRAQAELGSFFLDLYQRGIQSLIETHSEYLVLRLQQHVAGGDIDPQDIAFYYVSASPSGKSIARLSLDEEGKFPDGMPGGFFPERLEESKRLARIRAEREAS